MVAAPWLPALLVFLAVTLATLSLVLLGEWWRSRRRGHELVKRLEAMTSEGPGEKSGSPGRTLFRGSGLEEAAWVRAIARHVPALGNATNLLAQAGLPWTVQTYLLLTAGFAAAMAAAVLVISGSALGALAATALGALVPYAYWRRAKAKRLRALEEQLPDAIDLLGRAIRAGHPFSAGLKMVADEMLDPLAAEFRRVFEEHRFGLPLEDALQGLADRVDLLDVRMLVTAVLIQREVGGNLAEILDNIAHTIRQRFTIRRQLRVYTAQARLSGYILAVLPVAVGTVIFFLNREYMMTLLDEPVGHWMLASAAILQVMGYLWIRRIVDIEI